MKFVQQDFGSRRKSRKSLRGEMASRVAWASIAKVSGAVGSMRLRPGSWCFGPLPGLRALEALCDLAARTSVSNGECQRRASSTKAEGMKIKKIAFIGAGKATEAVIMGMLKESIRPPESLVVHDVWERASKRITDRFPGVKRERLLSKLTKDADIVVLAVKPQESHKMLADLHAAVNTEEGRMADKAMLVSLMAGKTTQWIYEKTEVPRIVRAMPNTPASIQQGCVVWYPTDEVEQDQIDMCASVFDAIGDHVMVKDESYLDMSTAIAGSGPYYLFLTMETMVDAGVHLGLPREMAERLVKQTLYGSCLYAMSSEKAISALRNDIVSPGGTTASAQYTLERGGFRATVYDAIWAAYRRSLELGGEDSNVGPGRSSTAVLRTMGLIEEQEDHENQVSSAHDGGDPNQQIDRTTAPSLGVNQGASRMVGNRMVDQRGRDTQSSSGASTAHDGGDSNFMPDRTRPFG